MDLTKMVKEQFGFVAQYRFLIRVIPSYISSPISNSDHSEIILKSQLMDILKFVYLKRNPLLYN